MTPISKFMLIHPKLPAMDLIQGAGIVSDLCIAIGDIAKSDQPRALAWLVDYMRQSEKFVDGPLLI